MGWARSNPRKGCTVMDDDLIKLRQPLIFSGSEEESDSSVEDDKSDGLSPHRPQFDHGVAAQRKRRRRKDKEDLGEGKSWMASLSATSNLLLPRSTNSSPVSLSMQQLTHRRKMEKMDEVSGRALALLALITLGFCFVLLLVVYTQAV